MTNPIHSEDCTMDEKDKGKTPSDVQSFVVGHHIEGAAKIIGGAIFGLARSLDAQNERWDRIAGAMERANILREREIKIREEHVAHVLEQRDLAARAAERLMGMVPHMPGIDLRERDCTCAATDGTSCPIPFHQSVKGPEWIKDVLEEKDAHTDKQS